MHTGQQQQGALFAGSCLARRHCVTSAEGGCACASLLNALSHVQASARETSAGAVASSTSASRQEAEARADAYDRRLMSAQQVVEQLKAGIGSLFQTVVSPQGWLSCVQLTLGAWSWDSIHTLSH